MEGISPAHKFLAVPTTTGFDNLITHVMWMHHVCFDIRSNPLAHRSRMKELHHESYNETSMFTEAIYLPDIKPECFCRCQGVQVLFIKNTKSWGKKTRNSCWNGFFLKNSAKFNFGDLVETSTNEIPTYQVLTIWLGVERIRRNTKACLFTRNKSYFEELGTTTDWIITLHLSLVLTSCSF